MKIKKNKLRKLINRFLKESFLFEEDSSYPRINLNDDGLGPPDYEYYNRKNTKPNDEESVEDDEDKDNDVEEPSEEESEKEPLTIFELIHNNKKIKFESIPQEAVVSKAEEIVNEIGGTKESDSGGVEKIYNAIHKPTHEYYEGSESDEITYPDNNDPTWEGSFKEYITDSDSPGYLNGGVAGAWSAWFLNACYIGHDDDRESLKIHANRRPGKGCCYPNVEALANRNNILNNPESHIGQQLYMIFSPKELGAENNNAILNPPKLFPGDSSIVGQGNVNKTWDQIKNEKQNLSGLTHMNVYLGNGTYAGGNLSGTAKIGGTANKAACGFMKLVKIIDVDDQILASNP